MIRQVNRNIDKILEVVTRKYKAQILVGMINAIPDTTCFMITMGNRIYTFEAITVAIERHPKLVVRQMLEFIDEKKGNRQ